MESPERLRARGAWFEDEVLRRIRPPYGPRNTWSNLAYAVVGVAVAAARQDGPSAAFAVAMILLATGSALYHATKTVAANRLDWLGMAAVFGVLVAHGWAPSVEWLALGVGGALGAGYLAQRRLHMDAAIGVCLVAAAIPPLLWGDRGAALGSLAIFAGAYMIWWLEKSRWFATVWNHTVWHILTALAFGLLFRAQG